MLADRLVEDHAVLIEDGRIAQVGPAAALASEKADERVDTGGNYLAPGFIDLHTHGAHHFLTDNGPEDLAELCRLLPRYGVVGFLPTICGRPKGEDAEFVASLAEVKSEGAEILGFHLEGPFLTLTGALPPEAVGRADPDRAKALISAAKPHRAIFSIAPDFEGIQGLIPIMYDGGVPVFITHTAANVEQTQAAIEAGAHHATHFYDVYKAPPETDEGVRPCGAVEAILADERVTVDFILDGEHVDPIAVKMALRCKGPAGVCLITDANIGAGLPPGRYRFGNEEIEFTHEGGPARLTEKSRSPGTLACSGLTMNLTVRNAVKLLGADLPQAVRMASANPARVLGLADRKGRVERGYDADLILFDRDINIMRTWVAGETAFAKQAEQS